jgi:hypothetical protein
MAKKNGDASKMGAVALESTQLTHIPSQSSLFGASRNPAKDPPRKRVVDHTTSGEPCDLPYAGGDVGRLQRSVATSTVSNLASCRQTDVAPRAIRTFA